MAKFKTTIILEPNEDQTAAMLFAPLVYESDIVGKVVVPAGFVTDGASVPRLFWNIVPPWGPHGGAAIVHDFLYRTGQVDRKTADKVFLEAMRAKDCPGLQRWIMFSAVRCFGFLPWNKYRKHQQ